MYVLMALSTLILLQAWDEELASIAQRWADQCARGHDKHRGVGEEEAEEVHPPPGAPENSS